ncbi:hypothetical protein DPMN_173969 [Dreissena polymorpha]|uniref:Uncharacterized protein n=1 Tax=Dreissena polymorpha TaxID=45954 RepID=A0A9D4E3W0_DREPO|nr:hypothetical protein DPMN_173969 [Dreissena polymorpha]
MAVVFLIDDDRRRYILMPRLFRERIVLENTRDENIVSRYRLSRGGAERVLVLIDHPLADDLMSLIPSRRERSEREEREREQERERETRERERERERYIE